MQIIVKLLLTTHQLIKLSKAQLTKMQKSGFLKLLAPLLKSGLPLVRSVIKPQGMLGLTAAASATDAAINKKILGTENDNWNNHWK